MDTGETASWRVELYERRRVVYEQLLWQVPSASFAGQAFLLTIVLGTGKTAVDRLIAALFGLAAAFGVLVAYVKHRYTEEAYAEWINSSQLRAGRKKVIPPEVVDEAFADRPQETFSWRSSRLRAFTKLSAFRVWVVLLTLFVIGDLILVIMSVIDVAGGGSLLR